MLSLQGRRRRRRRRPQRAERKPGGQQGGERAAGRLHRVLAARRRAALGSDGLSHALRAPDCAGRAAGPEDPLHGPEERHVPGPLPTFPRDPYGGLRPQPTGETRCQARGKGPLLRILGSARKTPGRKGLYAPRRWERDVCATPHSRGLMIDGLLAQVGLRCCGAERRRMECLSTSPPGLPRVQVPAAGVPAPAG